MIEREEVVRKILHDLANALGSSTMALDLLDLERTQASTPDDFLETARRGLRTSADLVGDASSALAVPEKPISRINGLMERLAEVSEGITNNVDLADSLAALSILMEEHLPGTRVAIMLRSGPTTLRLGAAPMLPDLFCDEMEALQVSDDGVGCTLAANTWRRVFCPNLVADLRWGARRDVAIVQGLSTCLSQPVIAQQDGSLVGILDVYAESGWAPTTAVQLLLEKYQRLVALAIQSSKLQSELQASEVRFRGVFEQSVTGMALVNPRGTIHESNHALSDLTGLAPEELIGLSPLDLVLGDALRLEVWSPGNPRPEPTAAKIINRISGKVRRVELTASRLSNELPDGLCCLQIIDVSTHYGKARALQNHAPLTGTEHVPIELGLVREELRTPIHKVLGFANALETLDLTEDDRAESVEHIRQAGTELLQILERLGNDPVSAAQAPADVLDELLAARQAYADPAVVELRL